MTTERVGRAAAAPPAATTPPAGLRLVDLSVVIAEDLPAYWPAHMPFQHKNWNWFGTVDGPGGKSYCRCGPYSTNWMAIDEHTGTHFDAPSHFVAPPDSGLPQAGPAGTVTVEKVPVDQTIGPAAVIDVSDLCGSGGPGESPLIEPDRIDNWEQDHGSLEAGDIVLLHTGWDAHYQKQPRGLDYVNRVVSSHEVAGWPAPSVATIEKLLARGIRCVGIDAPTMGPAQDGREVHVVALSRGAVFIEGLTGLNQVPARGAYFCFLGLKVEGGSGAPGRAVAWVPVP